MLILSLAGGLVIFLMINAAALVLGLTPGVTRAAVMIGLGFEVLASAITAAFFIWRHR